MIAIVTQNRFALLNMEAGSTLVSWISSKYAAVVEPIIVSMLRGVKRAILAGAIVASGALCIIFSRKFVNNFF